MTFLAKLIKTQSITSNPTQRQRREGQRSQPDDDFITKKILWDFFSFELRTNLNSNHEKSHKLHFVSQTALIIFRREDLNNALKQILLFLSSEFCFVMSVDMEDNFYTSGRSHGAATRSTHLC